MRAQLGRGLPQEIGERTIAGVGSRRGGESDARVGSRCGRTEYGMIEAEKLGAHRARDLEPIAEEPCLVLEEQGMAALGDIDCRRGERIAVIAVVIGIGLALEFIAPVDEIGSEGAVAEMRVDGLNAPVVERARTALGLGAYSRWSIVETAGIGDGLVAHRVIKSARGLPRQHQRAGKKS